MTAPAEPSTLAAAFSDQAQRTDGEWIAFSRRSPLGKGTPIRNAAGAMASAVTAIFKPMGQVAAAVTRGEAPNASAATRMAIAASVRINRPSSLRPPLETIRRLQ